MKFQDIVEKITINKQEIGTKTDATMQTKLVTGKFSPQERSRCESAALKIDVGFNLERKLRVQPSLSMSLRWSTINIYTVCLVEILKVIS
jgi:hypothetical protein